MAMTKIQRQKHITALNIILEQAGATLDRWGMYHIGSYKFDTREVNLKVYKDKVKVSSKPMTGITVEYFQDYINSKIKEVNNNGKQNG